MRNMPAILGIQRRPPRPSAGPMPMVAPPASMPPRGQPMIRKAAEGDTASPEGTETKMAPEKALVSHTDENCGNCTNYSSDSGECSEVDGTFQPDDRCWAAYESKGGGNEGDTGNGELGGMDTGGVSGEGPGSTDSNSSQIS